MNFEVLKTNLEKRGFAVSIFDTAPEALAYLDREIDQRTVGMGGSVTLRDMGVFEALSAHNDVYWHWQPWEGKSAKEMRDAASTATVYLASANAIAESGEIVNIDGTCNRIASMMYGHERVYLVAGVNKIAENFDAALWRARNVAAPKNARRLGAKTPCAVRGDRCFDCKSEGRICRALSVLWEKPSETTVEVVLIHEELGY